MGWVGGVGIGVISNFDLILRQWIRDNHNQVCVVIKPSQIIWWNLDMRTSPDYGIG